MNLDQVGLLIKKLKTIKEDLQKKKKINKENLLKNLKEEFLQM